MIELYHNLSPYILVSNPGSIIVESLESEEVVVFRDLLQDRINTVDLETKKLIRLQAERGARQISLLTGKEEGPAKQYTLEREKRERQIGFLMEEKQQVEAVLENVRDRATVPFVWDISFAEIFSGDSLGFDIVIGNPPYVRQESIADPMLDRDEITKENKKQYKAKLARSVYKEYPRFFGYKKTATKETVAHKIDAKSDLYIYFYFLSLSLLNSNGSFCFITSNSWLDVGYGKSLQEFLLKRCHTKLVIDNKAKRSFKEVDVNTVIVLFGSPADSKTNDAVSLEKTTRFVMFHVPFEEALHPVVFEEIAEFTKKTSRPEYRVFPVKQADLLTDGCEIPKEIEKKKTKGPLIRTEKYIGNKWGGKYLRAPDIYWIILEKCRDKFVRLGDIAEARFGIKTGANEFFHLDAATIQKWRIEEKFLRAVIKTPRDYYSIQIKGSSLLLFWCQEDRSALKNTNALEYIRWGESQGFDDKPSCKSRKNWYSLRGPTEPVMLWPSTFFERHIVYECPRKYVADKVFYTISGDIPTSLRAYLNSSIVALLVEVEGYQLNHGGIFVTTEWLSSLPVLTSACKDAEAAFESIQQREILLCKDELKQPDRIALDQALLSCIGLDPSYVEELHYAVSEYVSNRITKARRSVTKKGRIIQQSFGG